ncbi:MAG: polyvinylalcohol dehydrogenase, partial [Acidobacteria bacterium]|nr:polyvinylalcohol dehydrogenase [Acidobacteriota bacterium]
MMARAAACIVLAASLVAAVSAADWPGFRGPARDGTSLETGLFRTWPAGGPKILWKTTVADG